MSHARLPVIRSAAPAVRAGSTERGWMLTFGQGSRSSCGSTAVIFPDEASIGWRNSCSILADRSGSVRSHMLDDAFGSDRPYRTRPPARSIRSLWEGPAWIRASSDAAA